MTGSDFLSWFGETSLAVSILIALVLLARRSVARRFGAEAAYLLWLAPVLRLIMPTLSILPSSWRAAPAEIAAEWAFATTPAAADAFVPHSTPFDWSAVMFTAWAIGAAAFIAAQHFAQKRFISAMLKKSNAPSQDTIAEAMTIAGKVGMRNLPPIVVAADNVGPLVAGVFRPVIILPANFESAYSGGERQLAFAHEFAHIKRGDLATTLAALLFRAAQWPNPLAHFAFRAFRADQEAACDAAVIADNKTWPDISYAYGAALVKSASRKFDAPAASLAMSNHLKERLMLLKNRANSSAAVGRAIAAALIVAGLAASASYSYAAEKDAKKEVKVVKSVEKSAVQVIRVDGDEEMKIDGVEHANKIEVRNENDVRTVKIWDKDGKLISENAYGPDENMPFDTIVLIDKGGKKKVLRIDDFSNLNGLGDDRKVMIFKGRDGDNAFAWNYDSDNDRPGEKRKVVVVMGDDGVPGIDLTCRTMELKTGDDGHSEEIRCLSAADTKDPAARAAALKTAIAHLEDSARKEAEHREKMLAKLRAELADAEKEAKKK